MVNPHTFASDPVKIDDDELCLSFAQLGFVDGDTVRIIMRASGGGGVVGAQLSKKKSYLTYLPKVKKSRSKHKSNNQEISSPNVHAGGMVAGAACSAIVFGGLCGGPIGAAVGAGLGVGSHWSLSREWIDEDEKPYLEREAVLYVVYSSAFAPAEVKRKSHMLVQVYLHLFEETGTKPRKSITGYNPAFINEATSILASVTMVCYIMYTMSEEVTQRMGTRYLYLTCGWVLLGLLRYLQNMVVYQHSGSPTRLLVKDRFIQLCIAGWLLSFFAIIYL